MKRSLLLASLVICCTGAFSQISKGQLLAGGNAGFSYNKLSGTFANRSAIKMTKLQLSPGAGYFILDKLAAGARINFTYVNYHESDGYSYNEQLSLSPFVRYYFLPKGEKVNLFADASYQYGKARTHFPSSYGGGPDGYTISHKTDGYAIAAGPVIFFNSRTALELTVSLIKNDADLAYQGVNSTVSVLGGAGFQIHLGK